ncbi:T9SS type A sorting domain-containing protein, partial [bacterium]|nr:T9SS type A sorting domain-containing protein [bacterium]
NCNSAVGLSYQRFDAEGNRIDSNRQVPGCGRIRQYYQLAMNDSGYALFAWMIQNQYPEPDELRFQIVDPNDQPLINDPHADQAGLNSITRVQGSKLLENHDFVLAGSKKTSESTYGAFVHFFSSDGQQKDEPLQINADSLTYNKYGSTHLIKISSDSTYWAIFHARSLADDEKYAYIQHISKNGTLIGGNVRIPLYDTMDADDQGRAALIWTEDGNVICQRYQLGQGSLGDPFIIHDDQASVHLFPQVTVRNDKIYTTWTDSRIEGRGIHAYASVFDWANPTDVEVIKIPHQLMLNPAYPNPFNPETCISFTLPRPGQVKVEIFDIRGRLVEILTDRFMQAGPHKIHWEASDRPSGVYICRMECDGHIRTNKLILQK